jgi:hypothetical protein
MFSTPIVAGLVLFVYYAVSFTKFLFDGVAKPGVDKNGKPTPGNPGLQNGLVRLWALALGVAGAVIDAHFGSNLAWGAPVYQAVKDGALGAIGAIITWHVGQNTFIGAFDGVAGTSTVTTVAVAQPPAPVTTAPAPIVTVTQSQPAPTPLPTPPALPDSAPVDAGT